jgi:hypothetical protein
LKSSTYRDVPDEFIGCIVSRRHVIAWAKQRRQKVRIQFSSNKRDTLELIEYTSTCAECGTERVMLRTDDAEDEFVSATYRYPDGYLSPKGEPWDRTELRREWRRRHSISRSVVTRTR